jgi:SHAQKYF class myb-like DNA-binding protein
MNSNSQIPMGPVLMGTIKNMGRWTDYEHILFLNGLEMFNRDVKKIHIKTRSKRQIYRHSQIYFKKEKLEVANIILSLNQ